MTSHLLHQTRIAFIGGGNMATALIKGLLGAGLDGKNIRVSEPDSVRAQSLQSLGITVVAGNSNTVSTAQLVVIAVKPGIVPLVLDEISGNLNRDAVVISIAAGVTLNSLMRRLPEKQPAIRAMPNTPALIGAGVTVLCPGPDVSPQHRALAETLLGTVGEVKTILDESALDAVTALSGSGPAYVYLMIEALSDGGVACGLPRDLATQLAVQTVKGSAALVKETGQHPGVLKNQVTSPGGTTIAALQVLETAGLRGILMRAVEAAWRRSQELSRKN
ncbi:MAG: pyrroline-5-carboxylate reductase [Nitrospirae bacterium]|nr:pyrroline-5-carboxylate reductase [Magnetococcales bacterium]HAT49772.1 pyrroline-5-carboxylate reductase [Alphaproteobacteria bacterium]